MAKAKISKQVRTVVFEADMYTCRACGFGGSENYMFALDCDHIVAEALGGASEAQNYQCLCRACNGAKGVREWAFAPRKAPVTEDIWARNQKIVKSAFAGTNRCITKTRLKLLQ